MKEQKVTSLQILIHCAPHSNQIWLQMSIRPFLLWFSLYLQQNPSLSQHW